jgi:dipeptidyl aminopeptidase/acylaminoacyl peptidase
MFTEERHPARRVIAALALIGLFAVGAYFAWKQVPPFFRFSEPSPSPSPSAQPQCPSARFPHRSPLGSIVWIEDGALRALDLDTCDERTLAAKADPPVGFSPTGSWVAFGDGSVVPVAGGEPQRPLGTVDRWRWSPIDDVLAGVDADGALLVGGPDVEREVVLQGGAEDFAFDPSGAQIAVDVDGKAIEVVELSDGSSSTIFERSPGTSEAPRVAGWSPDGDWVLYWLLGPRARAGPLNAEPVAGGDWFNVFDPMLPYAGFVTSCGHEVLLAAGADTFPNIGNQILLSGPPAWVFDNVSIDFSRSWTWPACAPNERWVAATSSANATEAPPGNGARALWLLSMTGKDRRAIAVEADVAFETPMWAADGRSLLVVRRDRDPGSTGELMLLAIDPSTGKPGKASGPIARLDPAPVTRGIVDWPQVMDWYRPSIGG